MRCSCGKWEITPANGTGSKISFDMIQTNGQMKVHSATYCEGYIRLDVDNGTTGWGFMQQKEQR